MTGRTGITLVAWMIALVVVLGFSSARADVNVLTIGGGGPGNGGGSFDTSYWQPDSLSTETLLFLYCLDIPDHVTTGLYPNTTASTNGTVSMTVPGTSGHYQDDASLVNSGDTGVDGLVTWLLLNYALPTPDVTHQEGLQEAIWQVIYGTAYTDGSMGYLFRPGSAVDIVRGNDFSSLGSNNDTADVGKFLWFSPSDTKPCGGVAGTTDCSTGTVPYQALVGEDPIARVPEPSSILLLGIFAAGVLGLKRKLV